MRNKIRIARFIPNPGIVEYCRESKFVPIEWPGTTRLGVWAWKRSETALWFADDFALTLRRLC